jgi:hypothetical protein
LRGFFGRCRNEVFSFDQVVCAAGLCAAIFLRLYKDCSAFQSKLWLGSCSHAIGWRKRISAAIPNASLPRGFFCLATKEAKMPGDQITILKTTSERPPRLLAPSLKQFTELFLYADLAKPLALQARLSRPPMPLFFVVLLRQFGLRPRVYDSNLTSHQVGSIYFIFRWLALHEKSSQESSRIKG